jgi:hypothetical protein
MIDKIIIKNNLRVSKFIGTNLEHDEDLLLSKDTKVIEFLNKYFKYLNSCEEKDLWDFFKLTGLFIGHVYIEKKDYKRIYFSCNGPYSYDYDINNIKAFNNHIIIETYTDNLEILKTSIMADKKEIYKLKDKKVVDVDNHKWKLAMLNTKERVAYLKENNYLFPSDKEIKDILLDPFNNVLSLTTLGDLYINNILYSKKVDFIFELNSKNLMFIYKDNVVEEYVNEMESLITKKYDKVLYNENFLATLGDKVVYNEKKIAVKEKEKALSLYTYLDLEYNRSIYMRFCGVTDIKYDKNKNELTLIRNNEEISFPLFSVMILNY